LIIAQWKPARGSRLFQPIVPSWDAADPEMFSKRRPPLMVRRDANGEGVAQERRDRALAPDRFLERVGEVPDPRRQPVDELADPAREHRLLRRAAAASVDAGGDHVRAGGPGQPRANRPGAVGADARVEQRRHGAVRERSRITDRGAARSVVRCPSV
jgi:hypothetical protein